MKFKMFDHGDCILYINIFYFGQNYVITCTVHYSSGLMFI